MSSCHHHHHHHHDGGSDHHGADPDKIHSANKAYFDNYASSYGAHHNHQRVISAVVSAIVARPDLVPLTEDCTRLLDYACGNGLVSQALLPHVAAAVGMDLSEGMVAAYNTAAHNQGLAQHEMHAVVADLCAPGSADPRLADPAYTDFDLAVSTFAFHHIPDPALAASRIADRLKPAGGVFVLADFRTHQPVPEPAASGSDGASGGVWKHIVAHNGFTEEQVADWFRAAGLGEPRFVDVGDGGRGVSVVARHPETGEEMPAMPREVFVAIGRRGGW